MHWETIWKCEENYASEQSQNKLLIFLDLRNNEIHTVNDQLDDPIRRVSGAGSFVSLEVLLSVSMDNYVAYTRSYYGITVLIHSPEDYPQASEYFFPRLIAELKN